MQVVRGPTARHRLLVVAFLGTTGTAVLVLLAEADAVPALHDGAIVLITLATLVVAVRVRAEQHQARRRDAAPGGPDEEPVT